MKHLDFERAGFDWPSVGDDRVLARPREAARVWVNEDYLEDLEHASIPLPYPVIEDVVGQTVKDLALEKVVDLERALELSRRSRSLWFCWGVALSPFLAKAFLWLSAL